MVKEGIISVKVLAVGAADHASDSFTVVTRNTALVPFSSGQVASVELIGDRIICKVNGVMTHDVTDATYNSQTGVGLGTRLASTAAPARFDDFSFLRAA